MVTWYIEQTFREIVIVIPSPSDGRSLGHKEASISSIKLSS
jgi:hypothetical protein